MTLIALPLGILMFAAVTCVAAGYVWGHVAAVRNNAAAWAAGHAAGRLDGREEGMRQGYVAGWADAPGVEIVETRSAYGEEQAVN